jgi:solute carrier family 35 protein F1/2
MVSVRGLVRGQMLAAFVAGTGIFAESLSRLGFHAPTFLSGLNYLLLALVFGFASWYQGASSTAEHPHRTETNRSRYTQKWIEMCDFGKQWLRRDDAGPSSGHNSLHANMHTPLSAATLPVPETRQEQASSHLLDEHELSGEELDRHTVHSSSRSDAVVAPDSMEEESDATTNGAWPEIQPRKAASLSTQGMVDDTLHSRSHRRWMWFMLLALADVEGNFLLTTAYKYTDITSVMLLDCFTIPCVMLLSRIVLDAKYSRMHLVGVCLCLAGLVAAVLSDHGKSQPPPHSNHNLTGVAGGDHPLDPVRRLDTDLVGPTNPVFGDVLCLIGAALYAVANVGQELLMKQEGSNAMVLYLGHIGICGTIITVVQVWALEVDALRAIEWTPTVLAYVAGFVSCLFLMYTQVPLFLQTLDATLLNLSLLTADVWAVVAGIVLFNEQLSTLYFVSLALIIAGVVVYNVAPAPHSSLSSPDIDSTWNASDDHNNGGHVNEYYGGLDATDGTADDDRGAREDDVVVVV